jgi:N-acyl-D-amino-acid deacylase
MRVSLAIALLLGWSVSGSSPCCAESEPTAAPAAPASDTLPELRVVIDRGLDRLHQAAADFCRLKTCFSCHHQTLPLLAAVEADRAGLRPLDREWVRQQSAQTHAWFAERLDSMREGGPVPGGAASTGYGLWALDLAGHAPDETTAAMVENLLLIQGTVRLSDRKADAPAHVDDGRWEATCRRAPMQASLVSDTTLALIGIDRFANAEQRLRVLAAREKADTWLASAPATTRQDLLWRWWSVVRLGGDEPLRASLREQLLANQQDSGGWGETKDRAADAYSTGQTLYMLRKGGLPADDPALVRAADWLRRTQHVDGSWRVESHVTYKAQPFFDNGDPHGEHQFLSTAGTAWATAGLIQMHIAPERP